MNKDNNKELVKEFYPYISEAIKTMDNLTVDNVKNIYNILNNQNDYSVADVIVAQKKLELIIDNAVAVFKDKLIKNISLNDILLYTQVAKTLTDNKKSNNFFGDNTGTIKNKVSIDTNHIVGTKSFEAIQHDLFGGKPTIYKKKIKKNKINLNNSVTLYSTIPYVTLKDNQKLYRIATLIPKRLRKDDRNNSLIYGSLPTMYFISDNRKRDFVIARNNYIKICRDQNQENVKRYEDTINIPFGYDVSIKCIK